VDLFLLSQLAVESVMAQVTQPPHVPGILVVGMVDVDLRRRPAGVAGLSNELTVLDQAFCLTPTFEFPECDLPELSLARV